MVAANALVGQSGGPTSVINSSLQGVIRATAAQPEIGTLYGMRYGIDGLLSGNLVNLSAQSAQVVDGLTSTPSSALGSSRTKLTDDHLPRVLAALKKSNIRYFFLIGGNDTMDTIHRVEAYCRAAGYELSGIGIPKTVDNDLYGTDHTPGYPSAARYNALSVQQAGRLARDMKKVDRFVVYQTIGRDAGWLAAATVLARRDADDPPHLICVPERPFDPDLFLQDAISCINRIGYASIVVSEGIRYADGTPVSASGRTDRFGNIEYGAMGGSSAALAVHRMLADATGWRGEFQITESLPMCAIDRAVPDDVRRAAECGAEAVRLALSGVSGFMVAITRTGSDAFGMGRVPLSDVAVRARAMPDDMLSERGSDVTGAFLDYIRPLVGAMPEYVSLEERA